MDKGAAEPVHVLLRCVAARGKRSNSVTALAVDGKTLSPVARHSTVTLVPAKLVCVLRTRNVVAEIAEVSKLARPIVVAGSKRAVGGIKGAATINARIALVLLVRSSDAWACSKSGCVAPIALEPSKGVVFFSIPAVEVGVAELFCDEAA